MLSSSQKKAFLYVPTGEPRSRLVKRLTTKLYLLNALPLISMSLYPLQFLTHPQRFRGSRSYNAVWLSCCKYARTKPLTTILNCGHEAYKTMTKLIAGSNRRQS